MSGNEQDVHQPLAPAVRWPIFLHVYTVFGHNTAALNPANLMFRREHLPFDLLFMAPDNEQPTIDYTVDIMDQLRNIHSYAHQHLKVASDR